MAHFATELLPSAARTASGSQILADPNSMQDDPISMLLILDITAVSGTTPTLDLVLEVQDPSSQKWVQVVAFPQKTAVGTSLLWFGVGNDGFFAPALSGMRLRWTIGGTIPSFTFSVGVRSKTN